MRWEPCYTDPFQGYAIFDGITLKTDSITDPRVDRVIPIFEEEQILMCRQMLPLLKQRTQDREHVWALDIGTGSGVLAIWAAKNHCKVIAIDITQRSLTTAKSNAKINQVKVFDSRNDLIAARGGGIFFLLRSIENFAKDEENREAFDFVLMNPPYNPTHPRIYKRVATHAAPGNIDGQRAFMDWIKLVPQLLKPDGCCIGHQMSLASDKEADNDKRILALTEIASAFEHKCCIKYVRALSSQNGKTSDIPIEKFLQEQYSSYLRLHSISQEDFQNYIQDVTDKGKFTHFALVYYEACKQATKGEVAVPLEDIPLPNRNWEDRIEMHRLIVENIGTLGPEDHQEQLIQ